MPLAHIRVALSDQQQYRILQGDNREQLAQLPDACIDAIVTDPPYGLSFMGKKWDYDVPSRELWEQCLRVLKPGGHLLAFFGSRTYHRGVVAIEDAGFEVRDTIAWLYGSGFPKSHNIAKAIDKRLGKERPVVGTDGRSANSSWLGTQDGSSSTWGIGQWDVTAAGSEEAAAWEGWGTALKPAMEPVCVARKPMGQPVAANVLEHGTGAINIDGCRVGSETIKTHGKREAKGGVYELGHYSSPPEWEGGTHQGRWPANVIHDGSQEVLEGFPDVKAGKGVTKGRGFQTEYVNGTDPGTRLPFTNYGDEGSAARFFYCSKANRRDRDEGLEALEAPDSDVREQGGAQHTKGVKLAKNHHPTVKPTDLMRYLVRLVTPPGGIVLDPFMGSGSTGKASMLEGMRFVGCEWDAEYVRIAEARIQWALEQFVAEAADTVGG